MSNTPEPYEGEQRPRGKADSEIKAEETAALFEELKQREGRQSTVEPMFAQMQEGIKAAISILVPGLEWSTTRTRSESPCDQPYSSTPGLNMTLTLFSSDTSIPADRWLAVLNAVNAIAVTNGFDGVDLNNENADRRQISLHDPDGGSIRLGWADGADDHHGVLSAVIPSLAIRSF
ncbi:MAG: LppA family lipoprotein [Rhodococcus sp. (in: high G+C Gram-positive bacteria)]|uniref:LppA family lipoprotein n=1 Tax=Rhodococcus sp. TaxID=1831 RepID=UPI002AD84710|nr:LppA family lipoprotein [Rhodococcus sp. (in: high G+C Gram-positive bacteria)]MDZ7930486.1 LppA family lipoprotein [Rhodococcus sp. (in: high G+C Gram-positive bacteria)]